MTDVAAWPPGDGEMARRMRELDWAATPLGPIGRWPQSLRTVVDLMLASPGMMSLVWGPEAIHLYNDAFTELLGEHHARALGRSAFETFAQARDVFEADVVAGMGGKSARLPAQRYPVLRNGRVEDAWFDADYAPVRDETGSVAGVLWTLKEVTAQFLAERALRDSEARHRLLIERWTQAVWETDPDGVVVADSPSWRAYTGQTLDEWLGYGWLLAIHPDDRAYAERQWRHAIDARGLVDAEFRLRAPDGGWRWTNVRAVPVLDAGGRIEKWAGVNIDVDARRRAEAGLRASEGKYRALFESMDEAYAVVEVLRDASGRWADFRFVEVNPAFVAHTAMPWPVGKTATELLGAPNPRWTELYGSALDTGETIRVEEEEPVLDKIFDLNIFTLDHERNRVAVLFTDITERRRAEAALRESEERQAFLLTLSDALRPLGDAVDIQAVTARMLGEHLGVDRVMYAEVEGDRGAETGTIRGQFVRPPSQPFPELFTFGPFGPHTMAARYRGEPLVVADVNGDPAFNGAERAAWRAAGVCAAIVVPLAKDGRLVAEFGIHCLDPRAWTGAEVSLVREVAERTWAAAERARAEAALRGSEERYRTLFESIDEGLAVVEMIYADDGEITDMIFRQVNGAYERQTGIGDAVGRSIYDIIPGVEDYWIDIYKGVATTGRSARLESYQRDVDMWFDVHFTRVDDEGRFVAIVFNNTTTRKRAETELREREERQAYLLRLSDALRPLTDALEIIGAATRLLGEGLGASRAYYAEWPPGTDYVEIRRDYFAPGLPSLVGRYPIEFFRSTDERFREGRTWVVQDAADGTIPAAERDYCLAHGVAAWVDVPLVKGGTLQAALFLVQDSPRRWNAAEIALAEETAERTWAAIERARVEAALLESEERQSFLLALGDALRAQQDASGKIETAARLLGERLTASRVLFAEFDEDRGVADVFNGWFADGAQPFPTVMQLSDHDGPVMDDLRAGEIVRIDDVSGDRPAYGAMAALGVQALLSVPLLIGETLKVNLSVHQHEPRRWTDQDVALVREVAERLWAEVVRARAEAALRESEERFRTLAESIEDVFYITDLDRGSLEYLSPSYQRVWGRPIAELMADLSAFVGTIHPDDLPVFQKGKLVQERGEPVAVEYRIVRSDGAVRWIFDRSFPVGDQSARRSAGVASDITERKRAEEALRTSEERFRRFGEASQDILWMRDAGTLQWTYLTPAFETIYGLGREEALEGDDYRNWLDLILPEDREHAERELEKVREGEHVAFEYRIRRPSDGAVRWLRNTDFPIPDGAGGIALIGGIGHDVTDLRESERRSRLLLEELQHRVRNIMAMLRSVARRTGETTETVEDYVQHLDGRLSAMARTQALLTRDMRATVDLKNLIQDELTMQAARPDRYAVTGPDVALPPKAAEVLGLAIHELATNAVKYGALCQPDGRIDVRWAFLQGDGKPQLSLIWSEFGVRMDEGPSRQGFGTELVTRRVPYELRGTGTMEFRPTGLVATIEFPLEDAPSILQTDSGKVGRW